MRSQTVAKVPDSLPGLQTCLQVPVGGPRSMMIGASSTL